jgi:hypothetical protein
MVLASAVQDWSGSQAVFAVAMEQMRAAKTAGTWPLQKDDDRPKPITREWARGSVEWQREQAGEIVPHAPREKPASVPVVGGGTRDTDQEIRELFQATLTP